MSREAEAALQLALATIQGIHACGGPTRADAKDLVGHRQIGRPFGHQQSSNGVDALIRVRASGGGSGASGGLPECAGLLRCASSRAGCVWVR